MVPVVGSSRALLHEGTYKCGMWSAEFGMGTPSRLLKNSRNVIARSDFCDAAIPKLLISLKSRLLRFARKDG